MERIATLDKFSQHKAGHVYIYIYIHTHIKESHATDTASDLQLLLCQMVPGYVAMRLPKTPEA